MGSASLGGIATPIILRGTPLPARRSQQFSTAIDNQKSVELKVLIGESPIAKNNLKLKSFQISGIPEVPRGKPKIIVTFEVDKNCNVKAIATEKDSGLKVNVDFDNVQPHLTKDKVERLLHQGKADKEEDEKLLNLIEAKNKADTLIEKTERLLRELQEMQEKGCDTQNKRLIEEELASLGLALEEDNAEKIRSKVDNLEKLISLVKPKNMFELFDFSAFNFSDAFGTPWTTAKKTSSKESPSGTYTQKPKPDRKKSHEELATSSRTLEGIGRIFGGGDFTLDPNLCFVLMPFERKMTSFYDDCIRNIVESEGLSCIRADEIVSTNQITWDIWEKINRARFIIGDLTGKNPNVFYEVGIAHSLGKEVILISQSIDDVPFDLKAIRCIVYDETPEGIDRLRGKLRATIRNIMQSS